MLKFTKKQDKIKFNISQNDIKNALMEESG